MSLSDWLEPIERWHEAWNSTSSAPQTAPKWTWNVRHIIHKPLSSACITYYLALVAANGSSTEESHMACWQMHSILIVSRGCGNQMSLWYEDKEETRQKDLAFILNLNCQPIAGNEQLKSVLCTVCTWSCILQKGGITPYTASWNTVISVRSRGHIHAGVYIQYGHFFLLFFSWILQDAKNCSSLAKLVCVGPLTVPMKT